MGKVHAGPSKTWIEPSPRESVCSDALDALAGTFAGILHKIFEGGFPESYLNSNRARRHAVHAALSAPRADMLVARMGAAAMRQHIAGTNAKQLVALFWGSVPAGYMPACARCGLKALPSTSYIKMRDLCANSPKGIKVLAHVPEITPSLLDVLVVLPEDLRLRKLAGCLVKPGPAMVLGELVERHVSSGVDRQKIIQRLASCDSLASVEDVLTSKHPSVALPKAPWKGSRYVWPLSTVGAMLSTARRFKNCLESRIDDARSGSSVFYVVEKPILAVIEFQRDTIHGWVAEEVHGPNNRDIRGQEFYAVIEPFLATGIFHKYSFDDLYTYFGEDASEPSDSQDIDDYLVRWMSIDD